jgi:hypothetical protein
MPDQTSVQILTSAREGIYEIRRRLESLKSSLAAEGTDTISLARQELCAALVHRLEIAESEIQELLDMLELDRTA